MKPEHPIARVRTANMPRSTSRDMEITQPQEESRRVVRRTLIQNFHTAAKGFGKLCPDQNELLMQKGGNVCQLICEESQLRLRVADQPEVILYVSCNATVGELRQLISTLGDH